MRYSTSQDLLEVSRWSFLFLGILLPFLYVYVIVHLLFLPYTLHFAFYHKCSFAVRYLALKSYIHQDIQRDCLLWISPPTTSLELDVITSKYDSYYQAAPPPCHKPK